MCGSQTVGYFEIDFERSVCALKLLGTICPERPFLSRVASLAGLRLTGAALCFLKQRRQHSLKYWLQFFDVAIFALNLNQIGAAA